MNIGKWKLILGVVVGLSAILLTLGFTNGDRWLYYLSGNYPYPDFVVGVENTGTGHALGGKANGQGAGVVAVNLSGQGEALLCQGPSLFEGEVRIAGGRAGGRPGTDLLLTNSQYNTITGTGYSALDIIADSNAAEGGGWIRFLPNSSGWQPGTVEVKSGVDVDNTPYGLVGNIRFNHATTDGGTTTEVTNMIVRGLTGFVGVGTDEPSSKMHVDGSTATAVTTVTDDYTADSWDSVILGNNSYATGSIDVTLPPAADCKGRKYTIKKISASGNGAVSVQRSGYDMIEGASTHALNYQFEYMVVVSDGVGTWYIVSRN